MMAVYEGPHLNDAPQPRIRAPSSASLLGSETSTVVASICRAELAGTSTAITLGLDSDAARLPRRRRLAAATLK